MSTVKSQPHDAIKQLERAHQSAGAHSEDVRNAALEFYDNLTSGSWTKEVGLKLGLATSRAKRDQMSKLWELLFQSQPSEGGRISDLNTWMQDNRDLTSWMSPKARRMLERTASGGDAANKIDAAIAQANDAVNQAFGAAAQTEQAKNAIDGLSFEAHTSGAVHAGFHNRVNDAVGTLTKLIFPGAGAAIKALSDALSDPEATNVERAERFDAWRAAHPRLSSALDAVVMLSIQHDLSVASHTDQRYLSARNAVLDALGQKAQAQA